MKTRNAIAATAAAVTLAHAEPLPPMSRLLPALSWAETRDDDQHRGAAGEVSRFSIMPESWREVNAWRERFLYESHPLREATNGCVAATIAEDYLMVCRIKFYNLHGREPSLGELIALWRKPNRPVFTHRTRQLTRRVSAALRTIEASEKEDAKK